MRCEIVADWLQIDGNPVSRFDTPHVGGRMSPSLIVLHDTAGRLTRGSSVAWFMDAAAKVSAHFVVERDGAITQLAPCDRQTWHAGVSEWNGRRHVNGFSIGIEIVNPGKLTARGADKAVAWFGEIYDVPSHRIEEAVTDAHGRGLWMPYTDEQLRALESLIGALADAYPTIVEVAGHWQISPGRKVDPNPLFPARLLGRVRRPRKIDGWDGDVAAAQRRLAALGYFPGAIDGAVGPRTEAALFAFQRQNGIDATGKLSVATKKALDADGVKEMPVSERAWITETQLAETSRTVVEQQSAKRDGQLVTGLGVATTLMTAMSAFLGALGDALAKLDGDAILIGGVAAGGLMAAYGIRSWRRAGRTIGYRVEDARTGAHVGGGLATGEGA